LRLEIATAVARAVVIPALPAFQQQYPHIELVLGASDQPADLIGAGIDCVVRLGELRDSSMIARRIGAMPMVTCAAPSYLARHGLPRTLDDLRAHKAVNFFSGRNRRVMDWVFCPGGHIVTLKLPSGILTDNAEAFLSCGIAGMGLLQGVRPALQPFIDAGQLVEILPGTATVPKPVSVMYPDKAHLPDKVRVFVEWLTDLFARRYPV
jgi:DNA-binding transcriptional LysR family regulator